MKRLFTLFLLLAAIGLANVKAETEQKWWGYAETGGVLTGLGTTAAETYHCAIFIPGNHVVAGGKTINAVRFLLTSKNVKDVKVWLAAKKPTSITTTNCLQVVDVDAADLGNSFNEINLPTPYTIPKEGVYVGYSFTVTSVTYQSDAYPVMTTGTDAPNGLLLKTSNSLTSWGDLNGQGFGVLFLQVLLEGTFQDKLAVPMSLGKVFAKTGETMTKKLTILNNGANPIKDVDVTITSGSGEVSEQHLTMDSPVPSFARGTADIVVTGEATVGETQPTVTVTKVNGQANLSPENSATFTLVTLDEIIERTVVMEQYTGTGCGWCPRGHVGMAKMRSTFGDKFIGIALHQYSGQTSDAMYLASSKYASLDFGGAPSARMNRGEEIDPFYGSGDDVCDDFRAAAAEPATCAVEVSGVCDEDMKTVNATATVKSLTGGTYNVEFVVVADSLTGVGTGWNQANFYIQYSSSELGPELEMFASDGKLGTNPIKNFVFNDVAIASSYVSNKNQVAALTMTANETKQAEYGVTMPTYTKLKSALKKDNIYVVALVVGSDGMIVNAAKAKVAFSATGIRDMVQPTDNSGQTATYSLDGRQLSAPSSGISIVRRSDGRTIKVIRK